jgi:hypothetical protein
MSGALESRYFRELYRSILAFPESGYIPTVKSHRADETHRVINLARTKRGGYEPSDSVSGSSETRKAGGLDLDQYKVIVIV